MLLKSKGSAWKAKRRRKEKEVKEGTKEDSENADEYSNTIINLNLTVFILEGDLKLQAKLCK